jgi:hypothetical protein
MRLSPTMPGSTFPTRKKAGSIYKPAMGCELALHSPLGRCTPSPGIAHSCVFLLPLACYNSSVIGNNIRSFLRSWMCWNEDCNMIDAVANDPAACRMEELRVTIVQLSNEPAWHHTGGYTALRMSEAVRMRWTSPSASASRGLVMLHRAWTPSYLQALVECRRRARARHC